MCFIESSTPFTPVEECRAAPRPGLGLLDGARLCGDTFSFGGRGVRARARLERRPLQILRVGPRAFLLGLGLGFCVLQSLAAALAADARLEAAGRGVLLSSFPLLPLEPVLEPSPAWKSEF